MSALRATSFSIVDWWDFFSFSHGFDIFPSCGSGVLLRLRKNNMSVFSGILAYSSVCSCAFHSCKKARYCRTSSCKRQKSQGKRRMANLVVRLSVVVHMAADSDEIDPDFVRIDSQVTNRRNRTASCAGGSRHARWVEGGERPAHCPASGSSSSLAGPSSIRSLRFTRHMSTQVMAMITSVAEKMSGVRNEL